MEFYKLEVHLATYLFTFILCMFFVFLTSMLPPRYYFAFSYIFDGIHKTNVLITPELPIIRKFCMETTAVSPEKYRDVPGLVANCKVALEREMNKIPIPADATYNGLRLQFEGYGQLLATIHARVISWGRYLRSLPSIEERNIGTMLLGSKIDDFSDALRNNQFNLRTTLDSMRYETQSSMQLEGLLNDRASNVIEQTILRDTVLLHYVFDFGEKEKVFEASGEFKNTIVKYRESYQKTAYEEARHNVYNTLMERDRYLFIPALLIKLAPALFACAIAGFAWPERALDSAPLAAASVAFINCWPMILLWDSVVDRDWQRSKNAFILLYICYIFAYWQIGRLGCQIGLYAKTFSRQDRSTLNIKWGNIAESTLASLLAAGLTAAATWSIALASK